MAASVGLILGVTILLVHARLHHNTDIIRSSMESRQTLTVMLTTEQCSRSSVLLVMDDSLWASSVVQDLTMLQVPWGVGVFELETDELNTNMTYIQLSQAIAHLRQLHEILWCVTVVLISDSPVVFSAFAEFSFKTQLLRVQTVKLLAITRLPLYHLQTLHHLHKTFSRTNSLLAVVDDSSPVYRTRVFSWLPFTDPEVRPLQVASWTADQNLRLTHPPNLFPQKFNPFPHRPHVLVTAEEFPMQVGVMVDDPSAPGGKRLTFTGVAGHVMEMLSKAMNFTYTFIRPDDRSWGLLKSDGTWTGMLGLITRGEVEFTPGPFFMDLTRAQGADYSAFIFMGGYQILAALGRPEVDPWGFLMPLSPLVWAILLTSLAAVLTVMLLLPSCLPVHAQDLARRETNIFNCVRVLLQEDIQKTEGWWWWERVMLGVWMLMLLVLTQSYVGNLMSLLAVRHIDQPYQSLEDVLSHSDVGHVLVKNTLIVKYIETAKSGSFHEVGKLIDRGRVTFNTFIGLADSMETIVRSGTHVLFDLDMTYYNLIPKSFSLTGRCDFYISRSSYVTTPMGMLAQKNSPFLPGLDKLTYVFVESGVFVKWMKYAQVNSSMCKNPPKTITVTTVFSLTNLWGMFVALGIGFGVSVVALMVEKWVEGAMRLHHTPVPGGHTEPSHLRMPLHK